MCIKNCLFQCFTKGRCVFATLEFSGGKFLAHKKATFHNTNTLPLIKKTNRLFKKKHTISQYTSVSNKISDKTNRIISKDIEKLKLSEYSHLLRENIAIQFCLSIIIERIKNIKIDFEFIFNNNESEDQREVLRELVLVDFYFWENNPKAYKKLKDILSENVSALKLPNFISERFLNYKLNELVWNEKSISKFNAYMNDTRMGVWCAYNMVISLKRAILNETYINFEINGKKETIKTLKDFEKNILKSIEINNELKMLLEKEKTNGNTVYN